MAISYLTVDKNQVQLWHNFTEALPLFQFDTVKLHWPCQQLEHACAPEEYLKNIEEHIRWDARIKLIKCSLVYILQTPSNDPLQCIIIEYQDPTVRAIESELICTMDMKGIEALKIGLSNAFYMAVDEANAAWFPLAMSYTEKFKIKYHSDATGKQEAEIVFSSEGIIKYNVDPTVIDIIFDVKNIMPDNSGEPCGVWFKDIVVVPELAVDDVNECMIFKAAPEDWTTICSAETERKFFAIKMIAKKFERNC